MTQKRISTWSNNRLSDISYFNLLKFNFGGKVNLVGTLLCGQMQNHQYF